MLRNYFMNFSSASSSTVAEDIAYVIVGDKPRNMVYAKDFFETYGGTTRPNFEPSAPRTTMSTETNTTSGLSRLQQRHIDDSRRTALNMSDSNLSIKIESFQYAHQAIMWRFCKHTRALSDIDLL